MDIRKVKKLIELLEESNIGEIEIKEGEDSVRISRQSHQPPAMTYAAPPPMAAAAPAPAVAESQAAESAAAAPVLIMPCCPPWLGRFTVRLVPRRPRLLKWGRRSALVTCCASLRR